MSWGFTRLLAGCALLLTAVASSRADTLYVLTSPGVLQSIDPSTGEVSRRIRLQLAGKVVPHASGLGTAPNGVAYGLVGIADDCARDPSRTVFAGGGDGCNYLIGGKDACESAFVVTWDGPMSCTWTDNAGCEACGACLNTCAPPPPCEGSSRTQWLGFGGESCGQLGGEAGACADAYYSDARGAWSCFASGGQCLACDVGAQAAGACTAGCAAPVPCADATRDVFAGSFGCEQLQGNPDACLRAFEANYGNAASACAASGDDCFACTPGAEADGYCTNSCVGSLPCTGDPGRSRVPLCHAITDAEACTQAYTIEAGEPTSCFVNENHLCLPCTVQLERAGACADSCIPSVCSEDPARTVRLTSPDACHAYDADPAGCGAAFFVGRCGVSSCHHDAEAEACRPCTLDDPGRCENGCGPFEALDSVQRPRLVTIDLASAAVTVLGSPGDWFEQPVPDGTGGVYVLGRYDTCAEPHGVFRLDASDLRPELLQPLAEPTVGALARHPDGLLYRFASDGLFVTDPATGITTPIAVDAPFWLQPRAMTWAAACNAFLVADDYQGLWILDPAAHSLEEAGFVLTGLECDEGNCAVGLAVDGTSVCPPLDPPTFTTTTTTTSTSSSSSTTTLPSELVTGRRLLITNDVAKPRKRRLEVRSGDPAITLGGGQGSGDDPTLHGGRLRVVAASGTFTAAYALDDGWRIARKGGRVKGYEYRGGGAIRKIILRPGRLEVRGQGPDLAQPLLQDPGTVGVVLQIGGRRWCLAFGGTFGARTPGKLSARDAPAPQECAQP